MYNNVKMALIEGSAGNGLKMLRALPRVQIGNLKPNPNSKQNDRRGRAQHRGDKHGAGNKGSGQRQNFMRLGYETGNTPFYVRFPYEPYYKGHHLKRQYVPLSLLQLQGLLDTNRLNASQPIDISTLCNTGLFKLRPMSNEFGFQLVDEGIDHFKGKIHIEIQYASEPAIAAIERNGGVIRTAYYDHRSLQALINPKQFFERGLPIPKRALPPQTILGQYISAKQRGYLADPIEIAKERLVLAQKYGYELTELTENDFAWIKDPAQLFYGLEPGWVVSLKDRAIIKCNVTNDQRM